MNIDDFIFLYLFYFIIRIILIINYIPYYLYSFFNLFCFSMATIDFDVLLYIIHDLLHAKSYFDLIYVKYFGSLLSLFFIFQLYL